MASVGAIAVVADIGGIGWYSETSCLRIVGTPDHHEFIETRTKNAALTPLVTREQYSSFLLQQRQFTVEGCFHHNIKNVTTKCKAVIPTHST